MMNRLCSFILLLAFIGNTGVMGQTAPSTGLRDNTPAVYAFINAKIIAAPGKSYEPGIMVIREGIIESAGTDIQPPADAWIIDMKGKTIYPGFIDLWAETGFTDPDESVRRQLNNLNIPPEYAEMAAQFLMTETDSPASAGALHYNPQVRSWFDVASGYSHDSDKAEKMRGQGFVLANVVYPAGIFRGKTALVSLGEEDNNMLVVKSNVSQAMSFERSGGLGGRYPTSLMGVISLIRQTFIDTEWYGRAREAYNESGRGLARPEMNLALESLLEAGSGRQPVLFEVRDEIDFIRAGNIASEFGLDMWIRGSGHEYRRLNVIKDSGIPLVLPLNFPKTPDIVTPEDAMSVSLETLRHWDFAPENPGRLNDAGISFALTASGLRDDVSFLEQLRLAVKRGLEEEAALAALTEVPAGMLGLENKYGSLEKGKVASFVVTDGPVFESSTKIEEVWVDGNPFEVNKPADPDVRGKWKIQSADLDDPVLEIKGTPSRLSGSVEKDEKRVSLISVKYDGYRLQLVFPGDSLEMKGVIRLSASASASELFGIGELADGTFINWKAERLSAAADTEDNNAEKMPGMSEGRMLFPSMEYGLENIPAMPSGLLVKNATVWTQGPRGRIENAGIYVSNGKIQEVGTDIEVPDGVFVIDATGKHVTPGLVDPHLHTSIKGGVNETGNNMTPETRIEDVIESDNIWIYRLLAGGMTTANLLHGSANPVGGQDAVIKMRWGLLPDEMILQGAKPGLKLALGENVVRNSNQYPNTRMGAEQIIKDAFRSALDYIEEWNSWQKSSTGIPPRRDLQKEAMAEVLKGERIIHAHAYRQDEMQMLMRLAEDMGIQIASFEHTVEGYKIADILREHGAGAIIWTDWSSFKVESADGILYNAKTLIDQGVLTSLHSDNTQLSTRMNWEAGKMLATGIDEITAMDLITINPARIIGADKIVGSLEPGKDADFVIWSGHPLSGFTHAEQTWIDGRKYFDREEDMLKRTEVIEERAILIQKAAGRKNEIKQKSGSRNSSGMNSRVNSISDIK
ncbi:MAG: amidohydrolase family protein [Bacteroidales bacterium]